MSLDLKSLYIRIPNAEGIKAVKESCDKKKKCDNKSIDNIFGSYSKLKQLCAQLLALSSNKGLCGCAMGKICASSYANIFMDLFAKKYIYTLSFKDFHYSTYDSLMIYFSNGLVLKSNSQAFWITWKKHNSVKFEYKISQTSITFLDKEVSIQNNKLVTKIYWKSTDRQNFLYIDSDHP